MISPVFGKQSACSVLIFPLRSPTVSSGETTMARWVSRVVSMKTAKASGGGAGEGVSFVIEEDERSC